MSRLPSVLLIAGLAACAAVAPVRLEDSPADARLAVPMTFTSGLRVFLNTDQRQPIVSVSMVVGAGSAEDPPGKAGLAHLVEHLLFFGAADGQSTVRQRLTNLGAVFNAETGLDHTLFTAFVARPLWQQVLAVGTDLLAHTLAGVDEATFQRERDVVRNEVWERNETHGGGRALARLQGEIYATGEPYAVGGDGDHQTLAALTLDDARTFAAQNYRAGNVTFMLDGDVPGDAPDLVAAALPKSLTDGPALLRLSWTSGAVASANAPAGFHLAHDTGRGAVPELWIGWALPSAFNGPDGPMVSLVDALARTDLDSDSFRDDAPGVSQASVRVLNGRRGSVLFCRALLTPQADPTRAAHAIIDHLSSMGERRVVPLWSIDQRRRTLHNLALFADDDLAARTRDWVLHAHATGDPAGLRHDLSRLMVDLDPLAAGDFIREHLSTRRARAVLLTPANTAHALPVPAPAADGLTNHSAAVPAFPDQIAALTASLGGGGPRIHARALPNGLQAIVAVHPGFRGASTVLGFHGGTATENPPGVVEIAHVAGIFSVSDMLCGSLARCGVLPGRAAPAADATARAFTADRPLLPYLFGYLAQEQNVDWVRWPDDLPARQYRALRHGTDGAAQFASWRAQESALFPKQRWGQIPVIDDLERIDSDIVLSWSRHHQAAANTAVVVVGDVDATATLNQIADAFGGWTNQNQAPVAESPPLLATRDAVAVDVTAWPGSPQVQVRLACRLPAATVDDVAWQDIFARWIGDYFHRALREQLAATYGFVTSHQEYRGGVSVLRTGGLVANAALRQVLGLLKSFLAALSIGKWPTTEGANDPSARALDAQRWAYVTEYALHRSNGGQMAQEIFHQWNMGWPVDGGARTLAGLARVDRDHLATLAGVCHDTAVLSLAGDPSVTAAALAGTFR